MMDGVYQICLSSWIIQDGNYDDFKTGQEASFALEFFAAEPLQPARGIARGLNQISTYRYSVNAEVVFVADGVWVIDVGAIRLFQEATPPPGISVGDELTGTVVVGIDPFFYMEYLHKLPGMPAMTYDWKVESILRSTTPWIEELDSWGRKYRRRDEQNESYLNADETQAWTDDRGSAEYILSCRKIAGPRMPG